VCVYVDGSMGGDDVVVVVVCVSVEVEWKEFCRPTKNQGNQMLREREREGREFETETERGSSNNKVCQRE
jgi:hypothetical protein